MWTLSDFWDPMLDQHRSLFLLWFHWWVKLIVSISPMTPSSKSYESAALSLILLKIACLMYFEACFYGEKLKKQPVGNLQKSPKRAFLRLFSLKPFPRVILWLLILEHWQWSFPQATGLAYHSAFFLSLPSSEFSLEALSGMKQIYLPLK